MLSDTMITKKIFRKNYVSIFGDLHCSGCYSIYWSYIRYIMTDSPIYIWQDVLYKKYINGCCHIRYYLSCSTYIYLSIKYIKKNRQHSMLADPDKKRTFIPKFDQEWLPITILVLWLFIIPLLTMVHLGVLDENQFSLDEGEHLFYFQVTPRK